MVTKETKTMLTILIALSTIRQSRQKNSIDRSMREFEVKMIEKETIFIFPVLFSPKRKDIHTNGQTLQLTS